MAFVNFSLIFGGLLLAIPIVLHLVLRQQPKQLLFPAVRFIRQRQDANRRKLQLRHWLLLLLRCLAIALLAATLARPSVGARAAGDWAIIGVLAALLLLLALLTVLALVQKRGRAIVGTLGGAAAILLIAVSLLLRSVLRRDASAPLGDERAPVAAVLVFDSSVRMQYRRENRTRLERAQEIAAWLIHQLPPDSEVAVVDSRSPRAVFAVDLAAAERSCERIEATCVPQPLSQSLEQAVRLAKTSRRHRREVYVFTDLTRRAWTAEPPTAVQRALAEADDVLLYVIDVGVEKPRNVALGEVELSAQGLSRGSPLEVHTAARQIGAAGAVAVELYLEEQDPQRPYIAEGRTLLPEARLRSQQVVEVPDGGAQRVTFRVSNLEPGVHHGTLKIAGQDGLPVDNVRYFTVEVQDAIPVLVLAPPGAVTKYFVEAVAPYEFRQAARARYDCAVRPQAELARADFEGFAAVCLLDPAPLAPRDAERLAAFVRRGRGLLVFLGHNATVDGFSDAAVCGLLGGKLQRQWRSVGDLFLTPRNLGHPVTAAFRDMATAVPWNQFPVFRHWVLDDLMPGTQVVIPYANNKPALLETAVGDGRVLVLTTSISDPPAQRGREPWSELAIGDDPWPYVVLVNEMLRYLADAGGTKLNYLAGETAVLANHRDKHPDRYQLFTPSDQPQDVTAADGRLTVKFTEHPGTYRLKGQRGGIVSRGFSVNAPPTATDLARLEAKELDGLLGAERYRLAHGIEDLAPGVGEARVGREFYPFLLLLVALTLGLEQVLANRFYRPSRTSAFPG